MNKKLKIFLTIHFVSHQRKLQMLHHG